MVSVLRPGQRILQIPAIGVQTSRRAVSAGGVDWSQWFDHCWVAKGAASLAASYADLVGSTTLTEGVAPGVGADGWTLNGSTQYLKTGIIANQNTTGMVRFIMSGGEADRVILGTREGLPWNIIWESPSWYTQYWSSTLGVASFTSGTLALAGRKMYKDGVLVATHPAATFSMIGDIWVGRANANGVPAFSFAGTIAAVGLKNGVLNDTQVADAHAAMAAL